jgi:hypothetical protein
MGCGRPIWPINVKNAWSCTSTHSICIYGVYLIKHRDNFTFTYLYANVFLIEGTVGSHKSYEDMRVDNAMP